jgi:hypothetical protein
MALRELHGARISWDKFIREKNMETTCIMAFLLIFVPTLVIVGAAGLMSCIVHRGAVKTQLEKAPCSKDRRPLYMRPGGYSAADVLNHWKWLDKCGLAIEEKFLKIDLLFPFFYGGVLFWASLVAWQSLGSPFPAGWFIAPLVIAAVADWTENLIQLRQIGRHKENRTRALDPSWIRFASIATKAKLAFFFGSAIELVCLTIWMVVRALSLSIAP